MKIIFVLHPIRTLPIVHCQPHYEICKRTAFFSIRTPLIYLYIFKLLFLVLVSIQRFFFIPSLFDDTMTAEIKFEKVSRKSRIGKIIHIMCNEHKKKNVNIIRYIKYRSRKIGACNCRLINNGNEKTEIKQTNRKFLALHFWLALWNVVPLN